MQPLPIDPHLPDIARRLRERGVLVLVAPPGSGKTTRVPPALLETLPGSSAARGGRVIVLQPRRIAARASAARIASERGWTVGREVGYQVRLESRKSQGTRLLVVTEGILTRMLQGDPLLDGVAAVVLDEFHERSIHADFALAALREVRAAVRPDLAVLVMSATMDPGPVAKFLGGAPVVEIAGRPFPVEIRYRAAAPTAGGREGVAEQRVAEQAARALREAWHERSCHALVFLSGMAEIRRAARELESFAAERDAFVLPLHGSLSFEEQELALRPSERRKIVLSTNVAETSLTIDGVDLVIDGGQARVLRHDPRFGTDRLETTRISKHSADQRAGRAGRVRPGLVVRLWSQAEQNALREAEEPEIRRIDLASVVLELRAWGNNDPASFGWLEPPDPKALDRAEELLVLLGAVEKGDASRRGPLTAAGKAMLGIPSHPRIARILVAAHEAGVLEEGAALGALIEEREILPVAFSRSADRPARAQKGPSGPSDLLLRLDVLEEAERRGLRRDRLADLGVDAAAARAVVQSRDALLGQARETLGPEPRGRSLLRNTQRGGGADAALLRALLAGYPDRVARCRAPGSPRALLVGGRGAVLAAESVVRDEEFFLAIELEDSAGGAKPDGLVRIASAVRRSWLEEDFPQAIAESRQVFFDPEAEKVRATVAVTFLGLPLEEPREVRPAPEEAGPLLLEAARERAEEIFLSSEAARSWLLRVRSLRHWMPELNLPAFEAAELGEAIAGAHRGATSLADVRSGDLAGLLRARLEHKALAAVEKHAPSALRVPSGKVHPLVYEPGKPPVLAVRLQELFGLGETPRVAAGRVPVLLHLLGPNLRPVQITQDLRSFWDNTYEQVRKDLRARHPKHSWPENPWEAQPMAGPKRRSRGRD